MSLMKSLGSAVSGLRSFQTKMDVIGNNIANVDTPGFKASDVSFAEMFSQNVSSGGGSEDAPFSSAQVGLGVNIAAITRDFSNGSLQSTGVVTDLSIQGDGFFIVADGNQNYLTRAGNFAFNKAGFLVTPYGQRVQGYNANANGQVISSGTTDDIQLDFDKVFPPQATSKVFVAGNLNADTSQNKVIQAQLAFTSGTGVASGNTNLNNLTQTTATFTGGEQLNFKITDNDGTTHTITYNYNSGDTLDDMLSDLNSQLTGEGSVSLVDGLMVLHSAQSGDSQLNIKFQGVAGGTGNINFPSFQVTQKGETNSHNISSTVYDELGQAHTLVLKLTQTDNNTWNYEASFLDGENITNGSSGPITFDSSGSLSSNSTIPISFDPGSGANPLTFNVKLGNPASGSHLTQYSGSTSAQVTSQDGYQQGELTGYNIDGSGNIIGQYSNGRTAKLAQIAIGDVANKQGLESEGNNLFRKTEKSGNITVKTASDLANTSLQSRSLEGSNVDLAEQFTEMISTQRAYQANARVITTSDRLLQEVVNLKR